MTNLYRRVSESILRMFLVLAVITGSYKATAQECGSFTLNESKKQYEIGNFDGVTSELTRCLEYFSEIEKVQAYRLLAMTAVAVDRQQAAVDAITELLKLNPNFETDIFDPPQFIALVSEMKDNFATVKITSVSKKSEDVKLAPATVTVISGEEIKRRGYSDLEALFHDISGFDISRSNGLAYSNIYQRGYRSGANSDRIMFLVDGVEDNELWSNSMFISRQFSITNVKRVEIIYGPASTMYGPNAFTGVVNIITKDPYDYLPGGKKFAISGQAALGSFNTRYADVTASARYKSVSFSLTTRLFRTDEKDLSGYTDWDYKPESEDFFKSRLSIFGTDSKGNFNAQNYLTANKLDTISELYTVTKDASGAATRIDLSETGARKARAFDSAALAQTVLGHPVRFSDYADDRLIQGKLKIENLTLGFQLWTIDEGATSNYTDRYYAGGLNGTAWATRSTILYANYAADISDKISLSSLTQYRLYSFFDDTRLMQFRNYSAFYTLKDLVAGTPSNWSLTNFHQQSSQFRSELKGLFTFSSDLDLVSGFELRNSNIQGDYNRSSVDTVDPSVGGLPPPNVAGGNNYSNINLGFYAQSTYKVLSNLNLTAGFRIDHNSVRNITKTIFNERFAVVYAPDKFVFKAIYSTAFLEPTYFQKYATSASRLLNNPLLQDEKVKNLDISASYSLKDISAEISYYSATYSDVVSTKVVDYNTSSTTQFQSTGALAVSGFQAGITYKYSNYSAYFNFTYTDPKDDITGLRIGDIATSSFNIGANAVLFDNLNINLRANVVGAKPTGKNTTVSGNPLTEIDGYFLLSGAIGYMNIFDTGVSAQIACNNILDLEYYDPGVRSADNVIYASRVPQNERNFMIRLMLDL